MMAGAMDDRRGRGRNGAGLAMEDGAGLAMLMSSQKLYRSSEGLPMLVRCLAWGIVCFAGVASAAKAALRFPSDFVAARRSGVA